MIPDSAAESSSSHYEHARAMATGLLLCMAGLFVTALIWEPRYPSLSWLRAFAEAAMVGGLADWYAVTVLFRRPLGLPIPHTEIIPRNKARIATQAWQPDATPTPHTGCRGKTDCVLAHTRGVYGGAP